MINKHNHSVVNASNDRARQYRRFYVPCFIIFLAITLFERMLPQQWRYRRTESVKGKSIINEAKEQAGAFVPMLFMN